MDKKNLLTGRKRISELTGLDAALERKAELQAMVSLHAADVLPATVEVSASVRSEPVVPVVTVTAVVEPVVIINVETPAPVVAIVAPKAVPKLPQQSELPLPVNPPKTAPSRDTEYSVTQIADMLVDLHTKLAKAGDRNRRHYTPQMQANQMVSTLRELLRDKEKRGARQGLSTPDNLAACRLFIEELHRLLTARGIVLNPLKVVILEPGS